MKSISPTEFSQLDGATLVDVREPNEVAEVSVDGAVLLPMSTFQEHLDELPEGPLYIMCHAGGRSARVTQLLEQQGYDDYFFRLWEFYLCYCEGGFIERTIGTAQLLLAKPAARPAPLLGNIDA